MKSQKEKLRLKILRPFYDNFIEMFNSVTEFVVYVLRDLISSRSAQNGPALTKDEIESVKKRLKTLGDL